MESVDVCESCHKYKARYDAPLVWCSFCWAKWWYEDDGGLSGWTKFRYLTCEKYLFLIKDLAKNLWDDLNLTGKTHRR